MVPGLNEFRYNEYEDRLLMEHLLKSEDFRTYKKVNPFVSCSRLLSEEENKAVTEMVNDYYEQMSYGKTFWNMKDYVSNCSISNSLQAGAISAFNKTALGKLKMFKMDKNLRDDFRNTLLHMDEEVNFMKRSNKDYFMRKAYTYGYIQKGKKMGYPSMSFDTFENVFFNTPTSLAKQQVMKSVLSATQYYEY